MMARELVCEYTVHAYCMKFHSRGERGEEEGVRTYSSVAEVFALFLGLC